MNNLQTTLKGKLIKFNGTYFILALLFFLVEVLIAAYAHDRIIRPYVGDLLVVVFIYCFIKSFFNTPVLATAVGVLLFAYFVETLQYFHIINRLGLQDSRIAQMIIGISFEWIDIIAYTIGIVMVLFVERIVARKSALKRVVCLSGALYIFKLEAVHFFV